MNDQKEKETTHLIGRRGFILALGGAWAALIAVLSIPVYRYLKPQEDEDPLADGKKVKIEGIDPEDISDPGSGANGGYANRTVIVVRDEKGALKGWDAQCTHAGCTVTYNDSDFVCHCHGGRYDLNGKNVSGPPPAPLMPVGVLEIEGELFVTKKG